MNENTTFLVQDNKTLNSYGLREKSGNQHPNPTFPFMPWPQSHIISCPLI